MYSLKITIWPMPQGNWRRENQAEPSWNEHGWSLLQMLASAPGPMAEFPTAFTNSGFLCPHLRLFSYVLLFLAVSIDGSELS